MSRPSRTRISMLVLAVVLPATVLLATQSPSASSAEQPESQTALQQGESDSLDTARDSADGLSEATLSSPRDPATEYDLWVLAPAVVAILLAVFTRQVVPSLLVGILVGAYMVFPCLPTDVADPSANTVIGGFRVAAEHYILGAIHEAPSQDYAHLKIIVFTLVIGFVVGVIGRNGGTSGMVQLIAGETRSQRRGALTAWLAGLVVFFDDYANTMIVGPTMRSVFDRLKLSRAKLAYIVDSTAAPVSSIALIGTWVGAEIGYIQDGLDKVAKSGAPILNSAGGVLEGMEAFVQSIPYRFYPILALVFVFLVALTGRDFGPMKEAERKARAASGDSAVPENAVSDSPKPRWWLGLLPILVLVFGTLAVLVATGQNAPDTVAAMREIGPDGDNVWAGMALWEKASTILSNSDSYLSIFYGSVLAAVAAVILTMFARACSGRDVVDAGLEGLARMAPAIVILVLAWSLSSVLGDLQLGEIVSSRLKDSGFEAQWLPMSVFLAAALISFATGTSWGTMGILCPITVEIGANMMLTVEPDRALPMLFAAIGSVLAGAVFGDHCSPISDTTVLSSTAAGCRHEEHVWTQMPYAVVVGVASVALGDVMCSVYHQPWYYGLGAGTVFLVLWIFIVGRRVKVQSAPSPPASPVVPTMGA